MMVVFANTKGGVGKSTLAVHLAVWLFDQGIQTALLDCDQQRSSSAWITEAEPQITIRTADTPEQCLSAARGLQDSHDFLVGDGPAGLDDVSRTLLLLGDLAVLPLTPSILDLRSVQQATTILGYAQSLNGGRPDGQLVLNKMRTRDTISRELQAAANRLGHAPARSVIRDLQAFRDAAQQATVVTRKGRRAELAAADIDALFCELLSPWLKNDQAIEPISKEVAHG